MINILYFKIRSPTNHIASFTGFFQGLWPRSRQEALGTRLGGGVLQYKNIYFHVLQKSAIKNNIF